MLMVSHIFGLPVNIDDSEKATTVVASTACGLFSPISEAMLFARMWKKG